MPDQAFQPDAATAAPAHGARGVSALVLTKNEESNIEGCLRSLSFCDDIVVLDSLSTDRTVELARRFPNVRVFERAFDTEWKQRNYGLQEPEYRHAWVYVCDADERVPPELRDEILRIAGGEDGGHAAFRLRYKNIFMGRWIKRSSSYPVWLIRLVRPDRVRYEQRETNVHPIVDGTIGQMREHFTHYSFNAGLRRWFEKHNYYSDREAMEAVRVRKAGLPSRRLLRDPDPIVRRRAVKNLSFFLRGRALFRFVNDFVLRRGFLDGPAGLHYCAMVAMYEYWIELKVVEIEKRWRERTDSTERRMLAVRADDPSDPLAQPTKERSGLRKGVRTPKIDVFIPTLNESAHIAETVANALSVGPVFVLDSFSKDGTQELARAAGATVVEHKFETYSRQKNWGLDNLPFTGDWVFILDADERITPALREEILGLASSNTTTAGFFVNRVVIFMGRPIWKGGLYPSWNLRFFKRGRCRYEDRSVHEHMVCDGPTEHLRNLMLHLRRESISDYLLKHIKYADMESDEWVKLKTGEAGSARAGRLFKNLLRLRMKLRRDVWPTIPGKPVVRFFYMYFFRAGVRDGAAGWHLACLMASYEYMISLLYRDKMLRLTHPERATGNAPADTAPSVRGA